MSLPQKSAWWNSVDFPVSFIILFRTVIIMCINKEKSSTSLCWSHKVFREIPKLPGVIEYQLRTSRIRLSLDQNSMYVDIADVINEWSLTKFFFALKYDFFSFFLLSLPIYSYFHCFTCLGKRDNHNLKKRHWRSNLRIILKIHHRQRRSFSFA